MYFESKLGRVYYELFGEGPVIVFLHGWGMDGATFKEIAESICMNHTILLIDLLGFGKSAQPYKALCVDDYVEMLEELLNYLNINNPIILGHSLGGRIAIKYYNKSHSARTLILVSSAGIRPKRTFKYYYQVYKYKMLKTIYRLFRMRSKLTNLVNNSGSDDYKNASQVMKASLTKIVNEDLKKYLVNIDIKTYLIWGINDQQVPYEDALVFEKLIPNSQLYTFYQSGHFPYITEKDKFIRLLNKILLSGEINGTNQNYN